MKRILIVCNTDFYLTKFLKNLVLEKSNSGLEVYCACHYEPTRKISMTGVQKLFNVNFPRKPNPFHFINSIFSILKIIKENNIQVVSSHNRNASIAARIAAFIAGTPMNIYTAHGFYFHDDQNKIKRWLSESIERLLAKTSHLILSQTQEDIDYCIQNKIAPKDKLKWIGNGVNTDRFHPIDNILELKKTLNLEGKFVISSVGRLVKGKGFQDLIHAFYQFQLDKPNVHLQLIGGNISEDISPYEKEIKELTIQLKLENKISFTGLVDDVENYLKVSDVFALASYREGMSKSMLEAMACAITPVVSSVRGAREIIKHGENGFKFEIRNIKELAKLLTYTYNYKPELVKIGENAKNTILNGLTERAYSQRQTKIIIEAIESRYGKIK